MLTLFATPLALILLFWLPGFALRYYFFPQKNQVSLKVDDVVFSFFLTPLLIYAVSKILLLAVATLVVVVFYLIIAIFLLWHMKRVKLSLDINFTKSFVLLFLVVFLVVVSCHLLPVIMFGGPQNYLAVTDVQAHAAHVRTLLDHGLPFTSPFFFTGEESAYPLFNYVNAVALYLLTGGVLDSLYCYVIVNALISVFFITKFVEVALPKTVNKEVWLLALLCLGGACGFDIFVLGLVQPSAGVFSVILDGWHPPTHLAVLNPLFFLLYYPHHLIALLLLLIFMCNKNSSKDNKLPFWIAALFVVSMFGYGYLVSAAVILIIVFDALAARNKNIMQYVLKTALMSLVMGLLLFLGKLSHAPKESMFAIALSPVGGLKNGALFSAFLGHNMVTYALDLVLHFVLEFGWPLVFLIWALIGKGKKANRSEFTKSIEFKMLLVGLVLITFVRGRVVFNEVAYKIPAIIWLALALSMARFGSNLVVTKAWRVLRPLFVTSVLVSSLQFIYWNVDPNRLYKIPVAEKKAYDWIREHTPTSAVIQRAYVPIKNAYPSFPVVAGRRTSMSDFFHTRMLAGTKESFEKRRFTLEMAISDQDQHRSCLALQSLGIDYFYIGTYEHKRMPDMVFERDPNYFEAVYHSDGVAIYRLNCGE